MLSRRGTIPAVEGQCFSSPMVGRLGRGECDGLMLSQNLPCYIVSRLDAREKCMPVFVLCFGWGSGQRLCFSRLRLEGQRVTASSSLPLPLNPRAETCCITYSPDLTRRKCVALKASPLGTGVKGRGCVFCWVCVDRGFALIVSYLASDYESTMLPIQHSTAFSFRRPSQVRDVVPWVCYVLRGRRRLLCGAVARLVVGNVGSGGVLDEFSLLSCFNDRVARSFWFWLVSFITQLR